MSSLYFFLSLTGAVKDLELGSQESAHPLTLHVPFGAAKRQRQLQQELLQHECTGRVCPSIEFEFISTIMGQDFSVPIKPITRLELKASSQIGALSLWISSRNTQRVSNTALVGMIEQFGDLFSDISAANQVDRRIDTTLSASITLGTGWPR